MHVARVPRDGRTFPNSRGTQPCPGLSEACPAGRSTDTAWCPPGWAMPSGTASEWLPSESPSAVVWTQQRLARARLVALAARR
jgi:hypothetical protein